MLGAPGENSGCGCSRWKQPAPPADTAQVHLPAPLTALGCRLQHLPWLEMTSWPGFLQRVYSALENVFAFSKGHARNV